MRNKILKFESAFFLGPPGAGKSTIGKSIANTMGITFHTIDDYVPLIYRPDMQSNAMTDGQVNRSLSLLLNNITFSNEIVEFAYHDYVNLLKLKLYPEFNFLKKVVLTAPLGICIKRNEARLSSVCASYCERVWHSTQSLIKLYLAGSVEQAIVVDTLIMQPPNACSVIMKFLTSAHPL